MIKKCCVCGKWFDAQGKDKTCSKECRKAMKREWMRQYRNGKGREYNRNWMREYRKRNDLCEEKGDTLVGLNYAERQIAKTLASVEKIRTEL